MTPANDHSEDRRIAEAAKYDMSPEMDRFHDRFSPPHVRAMIDEIEAQRSALKAADKRIAALCEAHEEVFIERTALAEQVRVLKERVKDLRLALSDQEWMVFKEPSAKTEAARAKLAHDRLALDAAKDAPANVKE